MRKFAKYAAVLLLTLPLAIAQTGRVYQDNGNWTQEVTGSLGAVKNLRVKVDMGNVHIAGGSGQGINYVVHSHSYKPSEDSARRELNDFKVSASVRGDTATIEADWEGGRAKRFGADFVINVPREMEDIKVETDGGNLQAANISGRFSAETGGGNIQLGDIGGNVKVETGGGNVDVNNIGGNLELETGGGNVTIGSIKGTIDASTGGGTMRVASGKGMVLETGGGNVEVSRCDEGYLKVSTGGGSIQLGDLSGGAEVETGGGSIRLASANGFVRAQTGGGSIDLGAVPGAHAETGAGGITAKFIPWKGERHDSVLETSAGDITVYLASGVNLNVRASIEVANGHHINSDFPDIHVRSEGGDYGPRTVSAEGSINGGGPTLKVQTMTGDISFRRAQ
ncbi:MAG TPA: hypothetical protein VF753_10710 [Terriglobales bacterium]